MENDKDIFKELKSLSNLVTRYIKKNEKTENPHKLTRSQYMMIQFIYVKTKTGKVYQKDIENNFSIRRSTATEALKKLESLGLIKRKVSNEDARLKEITLTKKTANGLSEVHGHLQDLSNYLSMGITEEEKAVIRTVVEKVRNNILREQENDKNTEKF